MAALIAPDRHGGPQSHDECSGPWWRCGASSGTRVCRAVRARCKVVTTRRISVFTTSG